jgi:hypothetical protein
MATTAFSDLYAEVRVALGDRGGDFPDYENSQINDALTLTLRRESDYSEVEVDSTKHITPAIATDEARLRIVIRAALVLLRPDAHALAYKVPALTMQRGARLQACANLEDMITENRCPVLSESCMDYLETYFTGV